MKSTLNPCFSRTRSCLLCGAVLLLLSLCSISLAHAQELEEIYWTSPRGMFKADPASLEKEEVIRVNVNRPAGIAFDSVSSKIYWTDAGLKKIRKANLDGSEVEDVITAGTSNLGGISLDLNQNKMYWADLSEHAIFRSDLDGSARETLINVDSLYPADLALDLEGGTFYWISDHEGYVFKSNLDGSGTEMIISSGPDKLASIVVDTVNDKLYWSDWGLNRIQRSNLDGSSVETVSSGLSRPWDLSLDLIQNKIYWTELGKHAVYRANLDGSELEQVHGYGDPFRLTIDPIQQEMYWLDAENLQLLRADLNGGNREILVETTAFSIVALALDLRNEQIYWRDRGVSDIQRTSFEGSEEMPFPVTVPSAFLFNMAIDNEHSKIYWNNAFPPGIKRSGLDGSMVEDVILFDTLSVGAIALDVAHEQIYWIGYENGTDITDIYTIYRAGLDGSSPEVVIPKDALNRPRGLAIHSAEGKIYWTDAGTDKIQRANLDGTEIEDLAIPGLDFPLSIAIDPVANKIYWPHFRANKIQRANLDGSEVEDVLDVFDPFYIALSFPYAIVESTDDEPVGLPDAFDVSVVYPNPFSTSVRMEYEFVEPGTLTVLIYDTLGRVVREVKKGVHQSGQYEIVWEGTNDRGVPVSAGVYLVRFTTDSGFEKTVSLVKQY